MTHINGYYDEEVTSRQTSDEAHHHSGPIVEEVHHYHHEDEEASRYDISFPKLEKIAWLGAIVLEILIGFRIFLKAIAANPQSGFASFVYGVTDPFLAPFAGLTSTPSANGAVLEISSLIAMVVYALLFWLAIYVIHLIWGR
jgi:hypothetical protein